MRAAPSNRRASRPVSPSVFAKVCSPVPLPERQTPEAAWERVQHARNPNRPRTMGYISGLCTEFVPLHGDRQFGDDPALIGGIGRMSGRSVMLIGHQRGADTKANLRP